MAKGSSGSNISGIAYGAFPDPTEKQGKDINEGGKITGTEGDDDSQKPGAFKMSYDTTPGPTEKQGSGGGIAGGAV